MRAKLYAFIVAAVTILVGSGLEMGVARAQEDAAAVLAAHRAFRGSWAKFDADAIAKMLSDDLVWITRVGAKTDKAAMIAAFRAHRTTSPNRSDQQRVRVYGSIGVVTEVDYAENANNTAITEVWNKKNGAWVLILFQGSPVLAPIP